MGIRLMAGFGRTAVDGNTVYRVFLGVLFAVLLVGCGGGDTASLLSNATETPATLAGAPGAQASLAELEAVAPPEGVDAGLWDRLTAELGRVLAEREVAAAGDTTTATTGDTAMGASGKLASAPPVGEASATVLTYNAAASTLSWRYYSIGDYNQDGLVSINDLTPLGQRYGEASPLGAGQPFPPDSLGAVIDGNGDGLINISDITAIGQNYGARVDGYRVYSAEDTSAYPAGPAQPNGAGAKLLATVGLAEGSGMPGERRRFDAQVVPTKAVQYYWVRPCDGMEDGVASNHVEVLLPPNSPPEAELHYSGAPRTPAHIIWDATPSHDPDGMIVKLEWDFDGDGVFEHVSGTEALVDFYYYEAGQYTCELRVTDNEGATDTDATVVNVLEEATWHVNLADSRYDEGSIGMLGPIALLEADGHPALVYHRQLNEQHPETGSDWGIAYVRAEDAIGETWQEPVIVAPYYDISAIAINVQDHPTVVFSKLVEEIEPGIDERSLLFLRAGDPAGTTWDQPVAIATVVTSDPPSLGWGNPLAVLIIQDKPTYFGSAYSDPMRCIRADDELGSSWSAPYDAGTNYNTYFSKRLVVVGGLAAKVSSGSKDLKYFRALDAGAEEWSAPILIDEHEKATASVRLLEAAGHPAVVYYDEGTDDLRYRRALNPEGTTWGEPVVISAQTYNLSGYSIEFAAIINARPAMLYMDRVLNELLFVAANDPEGSHWGFPTPLPEFDDEIYTIPFPLLFCDIIGAPSCAYTTSEDGRRDMMYVGYYSGSSQS
jgi:PKD repeat protein